MFPTQLTDTRAFDIAQTLLGGVDHHDARLRATSRDAKARFDD